MSKTRTSKALECSLHKEKKMFSSQRTRKTTAECQENPLQSVKEECGININVLVYLWDGWIAGCWSRRPAGWLEFIIRGAFISRPRTWERRSKGGPLDHVAPSRPNSSDSILTIANNSCIQLTTVTCELSLEFIRAKQGQLPVYAYAWLSTDIEIRHIFTKKGSSGKVCRTCA